MLKSDSSSVEDRFLAILRANLSGLRAKVVNDFGEANFNHELEKLRGDRLYSSFAFDSPEYVLIRLMGRISISIGRRLGEIYDKIPRIAAAARFGLTPQQVAPRLENLELDVALGFAYLSDDDKQHVQRVVSTHLNNSTPDSGLGIEIRYNFNPNDSSRLRKDEVMADHVRKAGLLPIYLVFSSISPRAEAIARLRRAGCEFLIGESAINFAKDLLDMDLASILQRADIKAELKKEVSEISALIIKSYSFQEVLQLYTE
jgi:hypothetical protein